MKMLINRLEFNFHSSEQRRIEKTCKMELFDKINNGF